MPIHSSLYDMPTQRPDPSALIGKNPKDVPLSCQRILASEQCGKRFWIGPKEAPPLSNEAVQAYTLAHTILCHLIVQAPVKHKSGHPGGPLSAFTFAYMLSLMRDAHTDQPLRISPGHLSLLSFGLQWLFGREGADKRLSSPQAIIDTFRIPDGLPGHVEAGIGDIPFGTGPLGKGVSNALGVAFGLKMQKKPGIVDVLLADGDAQEGQVMEAFRFASQAKVDNLIVHGDFNDIQLSGLPSAIAAADFANIAFAAGWHVIEVQNGNDPAQVSAALVEAQKLVGQGKPIFVCYYTTMGNGIPFMEEGSNSGKKIYHGSPLSKEEAEKALALLPNLDETIKEYEPYRAVLKKKFLTGSLTQTDIPMTFAPTQLAKSGYRRVTTKEKGAARTDFGATHLKALMAVDPRIIVLHADLAGSGGFVECAKAFPERVINVGVAEANMYMMAAGMRQTGLLPVTYTFAAFGTNEARANARLIDINCGHTRCGIVNDCTHAGLSVGEDGETHQEQNYFTLPFRHTQIWMPADSNQAAAMAERSMEIIAEGHQSVYVFSPRTGHPQLMTPAGEILYDADYRYDGKAELVRGTGTTEDQATILAVGIPVHRAIEAADRLLNAPESMKVRVLNVSCIRPLDAAMVIQAALETRHLIVVEDHNSEGGLASQVADVIADFALPCSLRRLGLNHYFPSGTAETLEFLAGLDSDSIVNAVLDEVRKETRAGEDAYVSTIFELVTNARDSRFRDSVLPFIEKLTQEKGYLDAVRQAFMQRAIASDRLPSNDVLQKRLKEEM